MYLERASNLLKETANLNGRENSSSPSKLNGKREPHRVQGSRRGRWESTNRLRKKVLGSLEGNREKEKDVDKGLRKRAEGL